jgi:hypothetical protein
MRRIVSKKVWLVLIVFSAALAMKTARKPHFASASAARRPFFFTAV